MRKTFTMNEPQRAALLHAMRPVPAMWIGGPPRSVQQNANDAWIALGQEMGFDGMTVRPGRHELEFTAEEAPISRAPQKSPADLEYESWTHGVNGPPAYEVVYFRRRPDESEDWLRVPVGTAKQHVREELITRIVPADGLALPLEQRPDYCAGFVAGQRYAESHGVPAPAHSKSEYKRRKALGDPNVLPPAGVRIGHE